MGLSRNKVAVPEGAAGTTPFWRVRFRSSSTEALAKVKVIQRRTPVKEFFNLSAIDIMIRLSGRTKLSVSIANSGAFRGKATIFDILTQSDKFLRPRGFRQKFIE